MGPTLRPKPIDWKLASDEDFFDDAAVVLFEALAAGDHHAVVEAELMEDGGVEVGDVLAAFDGVEAEFVGGAVDVAAFDAASGHEAGEAVGVVVATGAADVGVAEFRAGGAAELGAPDDEGFIEHAALFEVVDEAGDGLIDLGAHGWHQVGDVLVMIPATSTAAVAVEELDEADALFDEAAGGESERAGRWEGFDKTECGIHTFLGSNI